MAGAIRLRDDQPDPHNWMRCGSNQWVINGGTPFTSYRCGNCQTLFFHYCKLQPDIYEALKEAVVLSECKALLTPSTE